MIGVIADDLTGAAELGGLGRRFGLQAEVVFGGDPVGKADLVCVDTDSRSCPADKAAARAAAAARSLMEADAAWIYKKVDSVLRGQIGPELEAILAELDQRLAILVPANPSLGRIIRAGIYFVRGRTIHQTEFANDPEFPRRSPRVRDLVAKPKAIPLRLGQPGNLLPKRGIVIGDAVDEADLQRWARQRTPEILTAGGVEFFGAMLQSIPGTTGKEEGLEPSGEVQSERQLFVCGTLSGSSRQFIDAARHRSTPVFGLPAELSEGREWEPAWLERLVSEAVECFSRQTRIIVTIGLPPVSDRWISLQLHQRLAVLAAAIVRRCFPGQVYVEGGATARELLRRLGWKRMRVEAELAPGVVSLATAADPGFRVTMKPGSYDWPRSIMDPAILSKPERR